MAETNEIENRTFDQVAGIRRVTLFPATSKRKVDTATTNIVYVGVAAAGSATSDTKAWILEKIDTTVSNIITITHATDAWDNRATASYT